MKTKIEINAKSMEELALCLPADLMEQLGAIARAKDIDAQELLMSYINEGIVRDEPKLRQRNVVRHFQEVLAEHNVPVDRDIIAEKFTYTTL